MPSPDTSTSSRTPNAALIALIGYRGTGKSTIAQLLAQRLGWSWVDADAELEKRAGQTIKAIFAEEGEGGFRDRETAVVLDLAQRDHTVLALGGGCVLREVNRQAIRRGLVVWLTADPRSIAARIAADPTTSERRPNLTTAGGLAEIEQLLAVREPLYRECADCSVDTVGKTPEQVVDEIVCFLQLRNGSC